MPLHWQKEKSPQGGIFHSKGRAQIRKLIRAGTNGQSEKNYQPTFPPQFPRGSQKDLAAKLNKKVSSRRHGTGRHWHGNQYTKRGPGVTDFDFNQDAELDSMVLN